MYIATNDKKIQPRPVLPGDKNTLRPWPKYHLEASTSSSPRPFKRAKTAPSSKDGPHILHSYKLQPFSPSMYDEDQSFDGYDSSSTQSDKMDEGHILSEPDEFLLGAAGTREPNSHRTPTAVIQKAVISPSAIRY